jgi:hypothetical protein
MLNDVTEMVYLEFIVNDPEGQREKEKTKYKAITLKIF